MDAGGLKQSAASPRSFSSPPETLRTGDPDARERRIWQEGVVAQFEASQNFRPALPSNIIELEDNSPKVEKRERRFHDGAFGTIRIN
jgi:hypothetical protein